MAVFLRWKYGPFFSVILESPSTSMATVSARTHVNLRPKHSCFEVVGTSPHRRWCDLINDFHSSVAAAGTDKFTRLLRVWCGREVGERNCVFHWEKKPLVVIVSRFFIACDTASLFWGSPGHIGITYCSLFSKTSERPIALSLRLEEWSPKDCNPHWKQIVYVDPLFMCACTYTHTPMLKEEYKIKYSRVRKRHNLNCLPILIWPVMPRHTLKWAYKIWCTCWMTLI